MGGLHYSDLKYVTIICRTFQPGNSITLLVEFNLNTLDQAGVSCGSQGEEVKFI
ncbi:hypothetical protein [Aphanothece sacrum]|uniref:Excinuclease ABC subunit A n=1 Tax=Aphanothece sacrum FPU1 TaxID=1920663 RepID=A0A401IHI3_APHSA|nr:hypothetical protein [Aphanothece sacrum]GBF80704.1 excinuclease ABC subunit A [Aphanothece sacrum FPU1]GBF83198.1 excinuclease ABC subunit A [Aphanothece sacrum FPU3]